MEFTCHFVLYAMCCSPLDSGKLKFNKSPIIQEGILDNLRYQILLDRHRYQPEKSTLQFSHGNYPVLPSKFFIQVEQCPRSSLTTKLWNSHNVKTYLSVQTDIRNLHSYYCLHKTLLRKNLSCRKQSMCLMACLWFSQSTLQP